MTRAGTLLTSRDREELLDIFLAATQAVTPDVTPDERTLLRDVLDRMLLEWDAPLNFD